MPHLNAKEEYEKLQELIKQVNADFNQEGFIVFLYQIQQKQNAIDENDNNGDKEKNDQENNQEESKEYNEE